MDWAAGRIEKMRALLADNAQWEVVGEHTFDVDAALNLPQGVREVEIFTALNHGKGTACNGYLLTDTERIDFCHIFQFAGVAKTAKIVHIRSYLVWS